MSKLGINTGSSPNDGTGDTLLQGAVKVNSNFDEVYTFLGDGSTLTTIENNKLANSSVSFGGISLSLGSSDDTPAFDLTDATNYPFTSLTGITTEILGDTTPRLGGDLNVNGNDIIGTGNVNLTGIITASSFSGSGANLTNLPAGQLTGNLPAIDGSALLNLPAQPGDGIIVEDDGVNIGSARTVNFGTGIDVQYNASTGIATVNASGGSLKSRTTVTGVTTSIANNGIGNTDITGFKSYALMKVGLSTAGWLRIYTDSTSRANDISRSVGEDPLPGSGVIAEVVTTGVSTTQIISPFVTGGNLDEPASETMYVSIKNLSGSTQSITANLTILQLEA